jgi:hypothetical protein
MLMRSPNLCLIRSRPNAVASDHFDSKRGPPALYPPPMDVRAEIERVEARIDWLLAVVQELQKRDDEVTAALLQKAERDLQTARQALERAKAG